MTHRQLLTKAAFCRLLLLSVLRPVLLRPVLWRGNIQRISEYSLKSDWENRCARLGKSMCLQSKPFQIPIGRTSSTRGHPQDVSEYGLQSHEENRWAFILSHSGNQSGEPTVLGDSPKYKFLSAFSLCVCGVCAPKRAHQVLFRASRGVWRRTHCVLSQSGPKYHSKGCSH